MSAILVADCVSKTYGTRCVLTSASLRAVPGQLRVLLGRNGEGKSTLLEIAAGCRTADGGTVSFDGLVQRTPRLSAMARRGLFYWPDVALLPRGWSLGTTLELLARRFGGSVGDALTAARCEPFADRCARELSGGERRRAELATVLLRNPTALLADEPLRDLAPLDAELIIGALRDLSRKGCAVVVTGHEVSALLAAADHVTWCTAGTTYEIGSPAEARAHDTFRREYLGPGSRS